MQPRIPAVTCNIHSPKAIYMARVMRALSMMRICSVWRHLLISQDSAKALDHSEVPFSVGRMRASVCGP